MAWVGRVVSAGPGKLDQTAPWIGESSVSDHRQYSSAELNTQGKALPLYHLRCRGMTNAYFGDPGNPGGGMRGGEDSRRRAELEKLYPAEIEERIRGIQSGAGWAEGQLERHYEKHRAGYSSLEDYKAAVSGAIQSPSRVLAGYYTDSSGQERCQWLFYSREHDTAVYIYQKNGYIGTAHRSRVWRSPNYTRSHMVEVFGNE